MRVLAHEHMSGGVEKSTPPDSFFDVPDIVAAAMHAPKDARTARTKLTAMTRWTQFLVGSMLFPALPLVLLYLHQSNVAERYDAHALVALPDVWVFALSFCAAVVMDLVSEPCQTVGQLFFVVTLMVLAAIAASEYGEMLSAFRDGTLKPAYWTLTELWVVGPAGAVAIAAKAFQKQRIESTRIRRLWR